MHPTHKCICQNTHKDTINNNLPEEATAMAFKISTKIKQLIRLFYFYSQKGLKASQYADSNVMDGDVTSPGGRQFACSDSVSFNIMLSYESDVLASTSTQINDISGQDRGQEAHNA